MPTRQPVPIPILLVVTHIILVPNPFVVYRPLSLPPSFPHFCHLYLVSRFTASGDNCEIDMVCDFHSELYPISAGEKLDIALASTLNDDGTPDSGTYDPHQRSSLMDEYDYVMYGKVFKISREERRSDRIEVYISYGGLLMCLSGSPQPLNKIGLDTSVYLLMRKRS